MDQIHLYEKLDVADFKHDNSVSNILHTQIRRFWSQLCFFFFVLYNFLHLIKFQGADSKYHNFFSNFQSKNTQKDIFGVKFKFFFARNFLKLVTQNYINKAFFVPKLKLFYTTCLFTRLRILIPNIRAFYSDLSLTIDRQYHFELEQ